MENHLLLGVFNTKPNCQIGSACGRNSFNIKSDVIVQIPIAIGSITVFMLNTRTSYFRNYLEFVI
jgi:hypothetical protein